MAAFVRSKAACASLSGNSEMEVGLNMKTAKAFVSALRDCAAHKTLYVMGCFGAPMTPANQKRYIEWDSYNAREDRARKIQEADGRTFGFDCVCLIKGILWGWCGDPGDIYGGADYRTDRCPDIGADRMIQECRGVSDDFTHILPGEAVWLPGHIGVYVGDGLVIESTPRWRDGVQYTALDNIGPGEGYPSRSWQLHGRLPYLDYQEEAAQEEKRYMTIEQLPSWARKTIEKLYNCGWLMGNGESLNLSEDMVRILVILDRAKVFE